MSDKTYPIWTGELWTFEQIVADLGRLLRMLIARSTPEELIDDCLQDAWLRLYERLEANPGALGPDPASKSAAHTRTYYATRLAWDAHKGPGFGPAAATYRARHIPESLAWPTGRESEEAHFGDVPGLDTVLFADAHHRDWMAEADIRLDLAAAVEKYVAGVRESQLSRGMLALCCLLYDDLTLAQAALMAGCNRATMFRDAQQARLLMQLHLRDYQARPRRFYPRKPARRAA